MKKVLLVVEDKQEEILLAKTAVESFGCGAMYATNLVDAKRLLIQFEKNIFGVVTDLHYQSMKENDSDAQKPNGLALVALCVAKNIRVAVCSDINHHFSNYLVEPIRVLQTHQSYSFGKIPFSEDSKNWKETIQKILNL
ncbi:MAG: hypothetical protein QG630_284 [Patescibacteria group bacterium]|nr:hypothetical protein [Patescibacteria group bacterium]